MAERAFNALHGKEIEQLILREVSEKLALEERFDRPVEVSSASFTFTLKFQEAVQPVDFVIQVSQSYKAPAGKGLPIGKIREAILNHIANNFAADERFSQHLTYPKPTWNHRIVVELNVLNGDGRPRELTVGEEPERDPQRIDLTKKVAATREGDPWGHTGFQPSPNDAPVHVPASSIPQLVLPKETVVVDTGAHQIVTDETGKRLKLVAVDATTDPPVEEEYVTRHVGGGETRHRQVDNFTGTGLPIDAAFKPSPGAGLAAAGGSGSPISIASGTGHDETIELGVAHPSIEDGGVGSPDAVRRNAGMAVPGQQTARAHSGIVDLPAGSF